MECKRKIHDAVIARLWPMPCASSEMPQPKPAYTWSDARPWMTAAFERSHPVVEVLLDAR